MSKPDEIVAACADCRFWESLQSQDTGRCRRYAPRAKLLGIDADFRREACFPLTADFDWCGEFEMRNEKGDSDE